MLDKIIDCLDGEDEYNCKKKQPKNLIDEIISISYGRNANESFNATNNLIKKEPVRVNITEPDQVVVSTNQISAATEITTELIVVRNITKPVLVNATDKNHVYNNTLQNHTNLDSNNHTDDYLQQSTSSSNDGLEIGIIESSEEVTDDPFDINTTESIYTHNLVADSNILQGESILSMNPDKSNISLPTESTVDYLTEINQSMLSTTVNTPYLQLEKNYTISTVTTVNLSTETVTEHKMTTALAPSLTQEDIKSEVTIKPTKDNATTVTENVLIENQPNLDNTPNNIEPEMENVVYAIEATIYKAKHRIPIHFRCHKYI